MKKDRILLSSIYFLFHAGLMAYKLFHPLWFYEQGKLEYFAVGYAFMALGGILSRTYFLFFADVMRISFLLSLSGVMLSVGICVSCIPFHIGYSILGGLISGFGATTFMSILYRITHMKESKESIIVDVPQVINYSKFIGTLVSVIVAYFVATLASNNLTGILVSSVLALISWMPLLFFKIKHEVYDDIEILFSHPFNMKILACLLQKIPFVVYAMITLSFFGGFFINMIMPYFPIILCKKMSLLELGLTISSCYLLGGMSQYFVSKLKLTNNKTKGFFFSNLFFGVVTASLSFAKEPWILSSLLCVHFMIYGIRAIYRGRIEMDIIPRSVTPYFRNLDSVFFFIGNICGMTYGYYLISTSNFDKSLYISCGLIIFSMVVSFYFIFRNMQQIYSEYEKKHGI